MPFDQIYAVSPDWLKLVFILAPWVSLVLSVWIWSRVKIHSLPSPRAERLRFRLLENENRTLRERLQKPREAPRAFYTREPTTIMESIVLMEIEETLAQRSIPGDQPSDTDIR